MLQLKQVEVISETEWKPVSKWLGGSMVDNNDCDLDHFEEICDDDDEIEDWQFLEGKFCEKAKVWVSFCKWCKFMTSLRLDMFWFYFQVVIILVG